MLKDINKPILKGHLSNPRKDSLYIKAKLNRVLIKSSELIQISLFTKTQVFHENLTEEKAKEKISELMTNDFKQAEINTEDRIYFYKVTDKGKLLKNSKPSQNIVDVIPHNKEKNYLLKEGLVVPPLVDLGVMNSNGYVVKAYYDKYKQINRFLEIIEDTVGQEKNLTLSILVVVRAI